MSHEDIVRAWKDAEYRQSLSAEEQALLPEHPAGAIELTDEELHQVAGGGTTPFNCPQPQTTMPVIVCAITTLTQ